MAVSKWILFNWLLFRFLSLPFPSSSSSPVSKSIPASPSTKIAELLIDLRPCRPFVVPHCLLSDRLLLGSGRMEPPFPIEVFPHDCPAATGSSELWTASHRSRVIRRMLRYHDLLRGVD